MSVKSRLKSKTPSFFKKLRNIGLVLAGVGTAIVTAPVSLPAIVVTIGGYAIATGSVVSAVSQLTTKQDDTQQ